MALRVALFASKVSPISKLIEWETRSKYSHAAIVQTDGSVIESIEGAGVHRIPALPVPVAPDRIDLFEVKGLDAAGAHNAEVFLGKQLGLPYDWPDLFGFVTRNPAQEGRGKWFCSELVFAVIEAGGVTLLRDVSPFQVSPGVLSLSPYLTPVS